MKNDNVFAVVPNYKISEGQRINCEGAITDGSFLLIKELLPQANKLPAVLSAILLEPIKEVRWSELMPTNLADYVPMTISNRIELNAPNPYSTSRPIPVVGGMFYNDLLVTINPSIVKLILDVFPGATFKAIAPDKPVLIFIGDTLAGLFMPLYCKSAPVKTWLISESAKPMVRELQAA